MAGVIHLGPRFGRLGSARAFVPYVGSSKRTQEECPICLIKENCQTARFLCETSCEFYLQRIATNSSHDESVRVDYTRRGDEERFSSLKKRDGF